MSDEVEKLLEHHGIRGMHWGVRKDRGQTKVSSDFKKTLPHRNKRPQQLSNKQLQNVNARINLEQNYARLNPSKLTQGSNMIKGLLSALGTASAFYSLYQSPQGKAAVAAAKKYLQKKV